MNRFEFEKASFGFLPPMKMKHKKEWGQCGIKFCSNGPFIPSDSFSSFCFSFFASLQLDLYSNIPKTSGVSRPRTAKNKISVH